MIAGELQKAMYAALAAANVCGGRIYDRVPETAPFPYAAIGDETVTDDQDSCGDAWIVFADVNLFSRPDSGSKLEIKTEAAKARDAVLGITDIADHTLVGLFHETTRVTRDADGLTERAVLIFRAIVSPL